jgi:hypothetical protein
MTPTTRSVMLLTPDADLAQRALDTVELLAKVAGSLAIVWGFVLKVLVPYKKWRQESLGRTIREVLKPELEMLQQVLEHEDGCAGRMEVVLKRQEELFGDLDLLLEVALDNRDRLDEQNDLLSALGLESERRTGEERRVRMDMIFSTLGDRRRERRRRNDA